MYKWVPCDPDISQIRQIYKNKQLNTILEAEENQKEESLGYHQSKITGHDLEEPLNPNYVGRGSNPPENVEDVISATQMFSSLYSNISTKSFSTTNIVDDKDNNDQFKELGNKIKSLEEMVNKLMVDEGIDENEARSRFIIEIDEDPVKIKTL
jgi:nitrogenase subunit NifH